MKIQGEAHQWKAHETPYVNGKIHGKWTDWHKSGVKRIEVPCYKGIKEGRVTRWYETGQKESNSTYTGGNENGNLVSTTR